MDTVIDSTTNTTRNMKSIRYTELNRKNVIKRKSSDNMMKEKKVENKKLDIALLFCTIGVIVTAIIYNVVIK